MMEGKNMKKINWNKTLYYMGIVALLLPIYVLIKNNSNLMANITGTSDKMLSVDYNLTYNDVFHDQAFKEGILKKMYEIEGKELTREKLSILGSEKLDKKALDSIDVLDLSKQNIKTTQGIEYLLNLEEIDLSNNQIDKINLNNNQKLKLLNLENNFLPNINLINLKELIELNLKNNRLKKIDLSKNGDLLKLNLAKNKLDTLDISKQSLLVEFNVSENNLAKLNLLYNGLLDSLDVSENKLFKLEVVHLQYLKDLNAKGVGLQKLDLISNKEIKNLNLENNQIKELNLDNLKQLEKLNLSENILENVNLSKNNRLQKLKLSKNNLEEIDLSKNLLLKDVDLSLNKIKYVDFSKNVKLEKLNLSTNKLQGINLDNQELLTDLVLDKNQLKKIDLSKQTILMTLNLFQNDLEEVDLKENKKLVDLRLGKNYLTNLDLSENTELKTLSISSNNLKNLSLKNLENLEKLWLKNLRLKTLDLKHLKNLKFLDIEENEIVDFSFLNGLELDYNIKNQRPVIVDDLKNEIVVKFVGTDMKEIVPEKSENYEYDSKTHKFTFKTEEVVDINYDLGSLKVIRIDLDKINHGLTEKIETQGFTKESSLNYLKEYSTLEYFNNLLKKEKTEEVALELIGAFKDFEVSKRTLKVDKSGLEELYTKMTTTFEFDDETKDLLDSAKELLEETKFETVEELITYKEEVMNLKEYLLNALKSLGATSKNVDGLLEEKLETEYFKDESIELYKKELKNINSLDSVSDKLALIDSAASKLEFETEELVDYLNEASETSLVDKTPISKVEFLESQKEMEQVLDGAMRASTLIEKNIVSRNISNAQKNYLRARGNLSKIIDKKEVEKSVESLIRLNRRTINEEEAATLGRLVHEGRSLKRNLNATDKEVNNYVQKVANFLEEDNQYDNPKTGHTSIFFLVVSMGIVLLLYKYLQKKNLLRAS